MNTSAVTTFTLAIYFACFVSFSNQTEAGVLSSSAAKVAARKAAARQAAVISRGVQKRSVKGTGTSLTREETVAMQRQLVALDRNALARIEARYGEYIPISKLRESAKCSTCFLDRHAYDAHLRRSYPQLTAADRNAILGDFKNGKIFVNSEGKQIQTTVTHERLHQLSNQDFRLRAGTRLDEGFTEHFSGKIYSDLALKDSAIVYRQEQRLVQMMQAHVGENSMAKAYFSGDIASLRQSLDSQLGRGAFQQIVRQAERGDFAAAERVLMRGR
jgi:hypothetical protein